MESLIALHHIAIGHQLEELNCLTGQVYDLLIAVLLTDVK
jgi:hypothetical protein